MVRCSYTQTDVDRDQWRVWHHHAQKRQSVTQTTYQGMKDDIFNKTHFLSLQNVVKHVRISADTGIDKLSRKDNAKLADILQTTFSNAFSRLKIVVFRYKCINAWFQKSYWFVSYWLGNRLVNKCCPSRRHTIAWNDSNQGLRCHLMSLGHNELVIMWYFSTGNQDRLRRIDI